MLTIEPRMVDLIWAHGLFSFKNMSFWWLFLDSHLTAYCSNIGVHIIVTFDLGMSILKWYNTQCIIECLKSNHLHLTIEYYDPRKQKGCSRQTCVWTKPCNMFMKSRCLSSSKRSSSDLLCSCMYKLHVSAMHSSSSTCDLQKLQFQLSWCLFTHSSIRLTDEELNQLL